MVQSRMSEWLIKEWAHRFYYTLIRSNLRVPRTCNYYFLSKVHKKTHDFLLVVAHRSLLATNNEEKTRQILFI